MATEFAAPAGPAARPSDVVALTGRLLIAAIFILSGIGKIAQPGATITYIGAAGLPFPKVALAASVLIELGGGLALAFGFHTRIAALVLAIFSLATAFVFHSALADQNQFIHFFKNLAMTGGLLQVIAFGGARLSLDGWRARRSLSARMSSKRDAGLAVGRVGPSTETNGTLPGSAARRGHRQPG